MLLSGIQLAQLGAVTRQVVLDRPLDREQLGCFIQQKLGFLNAAAVCAAQRVGWIRCRSKLVCEGQLHDAPIAPAVQIVERLGVWAKRTVTGEVRTTRKFHR